MKATPRTPSSLQCQIGIANASQKKSEVGESHRAIAGDRSGNRRRRKSPTKSRGRRGRKVVGQKGPWPAAASPGRCHGSFARRRRRGGGTPLAGVVSACLSLSRSLSLSLSLRQARTLLQAGACSSRAGSCGEGALKKKKKKRVKVFNELFGKRWTGGVEGAGDRGSEGLASRLRPLRDPQNNP